jgi:phosphatidate cytidylyltransferase
MTRVLSGAALAALAIVVVWFAPLPVFETVAFTLLFIAVEELVELFRANGVQVPLWPAAGGALMTLAAFVESLTGAGRPLELVLMAELLAIALASLSAWRGGADALGAVSGTLFPSIYVALPIGAMVEIREHAGPAPLFLLMLTVIVSDTAQYYTGRLLGRRPLSAAVSPKKTIEGAMGGLVFGTLLFAVVGIWWLPVVPAALRVVLGVGVVAVGIAGDLFESMLKRSVGVKDSSTIIPGHGGILDRIDALLFAAPFYYIVLKYL